MLLQHPLCHRLFVATLFEGLCRGDADMSSQAEEKYPDETRRSPSPVTEWDEKVSKMASCNKPKRRKRNNRRGTKEEQQEEEGATLSGGDEELSKRADLPSVERPRINAKQWRRVVGQAHQSRNTNKIRSLSSRQRGTSGRKLRKRDNSESPNFEPAQLTPIIEIQESLLSQENISLYEKEDMKLTEELKSMLSQMTHELSLVPTFDETAKENDPKSSFQDETVNVNRIRTEGSGDQYTMNDVKEEDEVDTDDNSSSSSDSEEYAVSVQIENSDDCSPSETEILLIEQDGNICSSAANQYVITMAAE